MSSDPSLPDPQAVRAAAQRIAGKIRVTPLMEVEPDEAALPFPLTFKLEGLQHSGSFKVRGAFNALLRTAVPPAGVAAASGGNHGAAVAHAAQTLGLPARIFVPEIASPAKLERIRAAGAEVVVAGQRYADALALCEAFQVESGAIGIHAYDAAATIAGQGTLGLEWEQQDESFDTLLIAAGGGGLIAGLAAWFQGRKRLIGVEPEGSAALKAALDAGAPVDVAVESVAADSLGAKSAGQLTHALAARFVEQVVLVPDSAILEAQAFLWRRFRLAVEPGGAAALAALLCGAYRPAASERVGVLLCGANVDLTRLAEVVASAGR
ncbi:MAG: serine/threonine dehydratase [Pseudomonadota bacterium]